MLLNLLVHLLPNRGPWKEVGTPTQPILQIVVAVPHRLCNAQWSMQLLLHQHLFRELPLWKEVRPPLDSPLYARFTDHSPLHVSSGARNDTCTLRRSGIKRLCSAPRRRRRVSTPFFC